MVQRFTEGRISEALKRVGVLLGIARDLQGAWSPRSEVLQLASQVRRDGFVYYEQAQEVEGLKR